MLSVVQSGILMHVAWHAFMLHLAPSLHLDPAWCGIQHLYHTLHPCYIYTSPIGITITLPVLQVHACHTSTF